MTTARPTGRQAEAAPATVHPLFSATAPEPDAAGLPALPDSASRWSDAQLVADLMALDPVGLGGVHLQGPPGVVRDAWLQRLRQALHSAGSHDLVRRMPQHADDSRLIGGLDLTATLHQGRPVLQQGLLAELDGHILICPMAERLPRRTVSHLTHSLDRREIHIEREGLSSHRPSRFALVALDEADPSSEEAPIEAALSERLAFKVDLKGIDWRITGVDAWDTRAAEDDEAVLSADELSAARAALPTISAPPTVVAALVQAALALGIQSLRAPWWAVQAACALAALRGLNGPGHDEVVDAARLVLGPRATQLPTSPTADPPGEQDQTPAEPPDTPQASEPHPPQPPPPGERTDEVPTSDAAQPPRPPVPDPHQDESAQELTVAAVSAALPAGLLALMARQQGLTSSGRGRGGPQAASRAGERQRVGTRGRPVGVRVGQPEQGHRLSLIDTLRQAAPWQRLRQSQHLRAPTLATGSRPQSRQGPRVWVTREDFRVIAREPRRPTTTLFVVDASGSNALNRLAEAKGAVETMLAECYVRRDRVAVLGFRGQTAEVLLPPTRSLVRAKRSLAGLPGGGGTPMARALVDARLVCDGLMRRGETVSLVLLTDGKANVTLQGRPGREQAHDDAIQAARQVAACGIRCLLVDTSPKPQAQARELALAMGARYVPLPHARTGEIGRIVRNRLSST